MRWSAVLVGAALLFGCASSPSYDGEGPPRTAAGVPAGAFTATVERVVDGDTFIARREVRRLRVRLIGVDAPESVRPGAPVECFGPRSARFLRRLLPAGLRVSAAYQGDQQRDDYGRELWDVWLPGGAFVQGRLVRDGVARPHAYPPQTRYAAALDRLADAARREGRGLYRACAPQ